MGVDEAKEILNEIYILYPNFNRHGLKNFNETWVMKLMKGDYKKTKRKLMEHSESNPYPPSLADVLVKEHVPRQQTEMTIEADRKRVEAEKADPEKAAERQKKIQQMKEMMEGMKRDVYERNSSR